MHFLFSSFYIHAQLVVASLIIIIIIIIIINVGDKVFTIIYKGTNSIIDNYLIIIIIIIIIMRVELLLCNDSEMGRHNGAISGLRLNKHVPAATNTKATIEELCFQSGPCRDFISKGQGYSLVSSVGESEMRGSELVKLNILHC
jgi:hypothetical protein